MTATPPDDDRPRRTLVSGALICALALAACGAVGVGSDRVAAQGVGEYVLVQGEECRPIEPLGDGSRDVSAFYDYRSPDTEPSGWYHAYGPARELLREDASQLFLYRGTDGLSLVFLHDGVGSESTSGGTVETEISGLPADGEWVVRDDDYAGQDDDTFDGGSEASATWAWNEGNRTDGGAYGGLASDDWDEITVEMAFNEESAQYPYAKWNGDPEDNEVDSWIARSGGEDEAVETYDLDMDEPVSIARGTCAGAATATESSDATGMETTRPATATGPADEGEESGGLPVGLPDVPEIPDVPDVPAVPEIPDVPGVPGAPDGSGELGTRGDSGASTSDPATGPIPGMDGTSLLGVAALTFALVAIALVTLRR